MRRSTLLPLAATLFLLILPCAGATTYQIDPASSSIGWTGKKIASAHRGHVGVKSGSITVDDDGQVTGADITIDMTSITNDDIPTPKDKAKLVGHLNSDDFFGIATHPTANFSLTGATGADGSTHSLTGDLTIKGQSHSVSFPATISVADGKAAASGTLVFDRTKWGIRYGSGSFFDKLGDRAILDDITLTIEVRAATPGP